jgi:amino acid adenylation domain-containing protein
MDHHVAEGPLHELFERQAAESADRAALISTSGRLSYGELNALANKLAHHLINDFAVLPEALVVVCLDRGQNIAVAVLGILKAGAAYVPIDPATPKDRSAFIVRDTGARIVITERKYASRFADRSSGAGQESGAPGTTARLIVLDDEPVQALLAHEPLTNPCLRVPAENLAYVIYTSGTTGQPKGVLETHGNVIRLFAAARENFEFSIDDVWTMFHSFAFDFTIWEIWGAWIYGGQLVIPSFEQTRDPRLFFTLCHAAGVTVLCQTPSSFSQFAATAVSRAPYQRLTALRYVIFGGEALNLPVLREWRQCYGDQQPRLVNMYGITETTVHVTHKELGADDYETAGSVQAAVEPDRDHARSWR